MVRVPVNVAKVLGMTDEVELNAAKSVKYKKGDRVVVRIEKKNYLGTISKITKDGQCTTAFDDGEDMTHSISDIVGLSSVSSHYEKAIKSSELDKFLSKPSKDTNSDKDTKDKPLKKQILKGGMTKFEEGVYDALDPVVKKYNISLKEVRDIVKGILDARENA